ncbi:MAG: lipoyl(octanoyl) transferase LipB [Alphaproteobacteria bacterium]|nr:lipoyl(octanoyl) transferase LipB [Alphaproteobacteria bacterium]
MAQGINNPIIASAAAPERAPPALLADAIPGPGGVAWCRAEGLVPYVEAVAAMEGRVAAIADGSAPETVWLIEHPPLYTAGTSAQQRDLLAPDRFPVHAAGRGGQYTYHGPGQRIAYVMLDLKRRGADVRCYVHDLEEWAIRALWRFHVRAERRPGRVGLWVPRGGDREDKIGAIGVRVRRWVTFHGMALNVEPDLGHFDGIVPCGIAAETGGVRTGVTSLVDLGLPVSLADLDDALMASFVDVFGGSAAESPRRAAAACTVT